MLTSISTTVVNCNTPNENVNILAKDHDWECVMECETLETETHQSEKLKVMVADGMNLKVNVYSYRK